MTKFMKLMLERMNDAEYNRRFTQAVVVDKKVSKEDEEAYERMKAKYPTTADLPFELPKDFRDM